MFTRKGGYEMVCTKWITATAAAAVLMTWTDANAQGAQTPGAERPQMSIPADAQADAKGSAKMFLTHAAQDSEAEVELGKLAQEKAADAKVKEFAARMQTDHTKSGAEVRALGAKKGVTLPTGLGPHAAMKTRLEKLQGASFDQAYMKGMVDDHTKAVREFETASKSSDPDVKAFATKTLPTLREHLRLAQEIAKGVSGTGAAGAAGTSGTAGDNKGKPY
jgi:putative membrane protein